jgi:hypothetical protein
LVGELQRVIVYPSLGYAAPSRVPAAVLAAFGRLVAAGYDSVLLPDVRMA